MSNENEYTLRSDGEPIIPTILLTKREYIAIQMMAAGKVYQGSACGYGYNEKRGAQDAVREADALLKELSK